MGRMWKVMYEHAGGCLNEQRVSHLGELYYSYVRTLWISGSPGETKLKGRTY